MTDPDRNVIFISHATPQDNEFVKWLGARLIGLGYNVWADVFELKGGTPFWNTIEEAITTRAIKVIFVASTESVKPDRKGVRDELAASDITGRKLKDPAFVIPVRLDRVDFGSFPIQLLQLNALDFSSGWGGTLVTLVETLEKANVPTDSARIDERMSYWRERTSRDAPRVEIAPELLLTNLLPIEALPTHINFYEFNGPNTEINKALESTGVPYTRHARLIISFAAMGEIQTGLPPKFTLALKRRVEVQRFLKGRQGNETAPEWFDARNMLTFLLRRHVERFLVSRGLKAQDISRGLAFYFPLGLIPDGKVRYRTPDGKQTWKQVVGRSERRQLNWHLSMLVNIDLGPPGFIRFKPYICFSEGAEKLIDDPKRVAAIRRRFCKSWWNRHWRQLQQAFIAFLSGGEEIDVQLDGTEALKLSGKLLQLQGTRRLVGDTEFDDVPDEPDEPDDDEADEMDSALFEPDEEDAA
ncbi:toll/interleukin-1 receptor domain-containing protein [Mesorhizobium sp.]|uniref:toll/interleukin-1 receptor domain-containing protein n=1 Tax=Mesorhizobium sp. TaxID=1871066 RepID=UPI00121F761C|nr:toll/interleukin-1 receptor domain-containing protein [Mesorhizobium sp.]TIV60725.1 MAG: toll/interleukin-1 receptor domain-containing protein [Mesorhizobium sp.]